VVERSLDGKVAIVTGGTKGIGRAIARALAANGAQVMICGRTSVDEAVTALKKEGLPVGGVAADVGDPSQAAHLIAETVRLHGRIDILVNNAGIGVFKPVAELDVSEFDAMWNVNVRGVFLVTRASLPHMIKGGGGAIVTISSLAGKNTFAGGAGYSATKWALRGFAGSLMLEVRDKNIRVVTIFPGSVDTNFSATAKHGSNITQPEDVADAVVFAVASSGRTMISEIDIRPTRPR
jgi:3-oxoacyl-[acyl-carrier protein] reductase